MTTFIQILIMCIILIACIFIIVLLVLIKMRNNRKLNIRDASLSSEELENHAKETAIKHLISNKQNFLNWPVPRMNENYALILSVYKELNDEIQEKGIVPPAAEWLLDNFYIIEEQVKLLRRDLVKKSYLRLPVLKVGFLKGYARIYAVASELAGHTDGQIDERVLSDYLKAYQSHNILFDMELWAIPMVLRLALIENIRHLCENIKDTQIQWHKADEIFDHWQNSETVDTERVIKLFSDSLRTIDKTNPSFVEHLFFRLRRSGRSYVEVLRAMDESLVKLGTTTEQVTQREHSLQSSSTISIGNCITSLRFISTFDWSDLFESASYVEQILRQDPDGTYLNMDVSSRNYYRGSVEKLSSIYEVSEIYIAKEAIKLASKAYLSCDLVSTVDPEIQRTWHVGYYIIGKGIDNLEISLGKKHKKINKLSEILYFSSISFITFILGAIAVYYSILTSGPNDVIIYIIVAIGVLIPSSEIAVNLINLTVSKTIKPAVFPSLELKDGIPENLSTIVAVPTLLPDEGRVKEILRGLENHYLSNREENLFFVLIGAFEDSDNSNMKKDDSIIEAALNGIKELNRKYPSSAHDKFYFFHRKSQFNEKNNKWIGWERKRGALMEFNDLVLGSSDTSFSYSSCNVPPFSNIKYIITLDSDTILPMGVAKKMIGTMAHPLNRPIIDREKGIVIDGYGLIQPKIDVDSESSNKSLFSKIFTGQEGLDPYANAISDVYQDLFGVGIFTGKGIYDLKVFQSLLKNAIPENAILSHDLLEGSYVRTGLVNDLRLVDSYPSRFNSYTSRLHRWVRGDWQLFPLLYGKIFNSSHRKIVNPLSLLSKWKMFDNLRRSLVAPSLIILVALSFSILPGSIYFWIGFFIVANSFPFMMSIFEYLFTVKVGIDKSKKYMSVMSGLKSSFFQSLLSLIFLPHQAWSMLNAISITLVRIFITKKNLLEWTTSADVEKSQKNTLKSYVRMMISSIFIAPIPLILAIVFKKEAIILSMAFFVLWVSSPIIAYWVSKDQKESLHKASEEELLELRRIARKTWRYFEEFSNSKSHYLAPDNYQPDSPKGVAYRTSPTNIGFGLLAVLTARDFGYIGTFEMMDLIEKTIYTIEKLEKWNGHLYNWYDTNTLKMMRPGYISTVDSGNLAGYMITLVQGLEEYLHSPLVDCEFSNGIRDTLYCAGKDGIASYENITTNHIIPDERNVDLMIWNRTLNELTNGNLFENMKESVWKTKIDHMIQMFKVEITEFFPVIDLLEKVPYNLLSKDCSEEIVEGANEIMLMLKKNSNFQDLPYDYVMASNRVDKLIEIVQKKGMENYNEVMTWLCELEKTLEKAIVTSEQFIKRYKALITRINMLLDVMKFLPLYDKKKQLFSIGYNIEENKLTNSCYDLLASEARQTSYICIARGEIPSTHWFKMSRVLTVVDHFKGLVSWTGTMFEYLMPLLIMRSYKNTLLDETYSFVIKSQKKYGKQRDMPWGSSESGYNSMDINLEYQYKAIGVPWLGLKRGLIEDAVAAPYATFLALLVDPEGAIENIKRLKAEGLEGPYGFYEAVDYTPERLRFETKRSIIKSFMAHHEGMSLIALNNFMNKNIMQRRFHADPVMNAARLLLQEKVPANLVITKENKEKVVRFKGVVYNTKNPFRRFSKPDPILPKAHILSNGNYSIMITDRGTGYSKNKTMAVTRWREDSTLDPYGMFFYLRNVDTDYIWSATYAPINIMPDKYEVIFTDGKATFIRLDGQIETKTEVVAASGDNVEIRRISLKNFGEKSCVLELTSYFEVVLAAQAADVAHPAFSNLFVETQFSPVNQCIIANRRPRSETDKSIWIANTAVIEGETIGNLEYETDRMQFLGRTHNLKAPVAIVNGRPLSNTVGSVLDPVMSIQVKVKIEPGKTAVISFVTAVSENSELLHSLIDNYANPDMVEGAFQLAFTRSKVETNYLNRDTDEIELYQDMISYILFSSPIRRMNQDMILKNTKGQSSLWRYGISGDIPIVLVVLNTTDSVEILSEVLRAQEYWRLKDLKVDLVILSEEEYNYTLPLYQLISDIVLSSQTHDILKRPGDVFILDKSKIVYEDVNLLYAVAKFVLKGDGRNMNEQVHLQNLTDKYPLPAKRQFIGNSKKYTNHYEKEQELIYFNGLGGFNLDRNEYIIRLDKGQNTPAPWVNVIANPKFGFIVSESGSGYTWCENSHENKLTPWSNDSVSDSPGEILYIGDGDTGKLWTATSLPIREEDPYTIRHGFGYSVFEHVSNGIKQRLTQHVHVKDSVKISILSLKNDSKQKRNLILTYYVRPVLGVSDQVTAMHIKTSVGKTGALLMENSYNEDFKGKICFMDVSINERSVTSDRKEFFGSKDITYPESLMRESLSGTVGIGFDPCGAIQVSVSLEPNESSEIVFLLGMGSSLQETDEMIQNYKKIKNAKESLIKIQEFWKEKVEVVQVSTPTEPMNLMLDGWLQYQVISCRLWARSGFYQSGGAFGFRDQLQDCMSIAHILPETAREQIMLHARHQFTQGDVQHWWHEPQGNGIRTRITDDLLWLPYVTSEYIRITGDKEILQEEIPFLEDSVLAETENERYGKSKVSSTTSSLYEHCVRAIDISMKFGKHNLPLIGTGDWNDGMNTVGNGGLGESVWLGWFLVSVLEMFTPICDELGDIKRVEKYYDVKKKITDAIEKSGWDGNWYRRAYFDNGLPLGSIQNTDCKIDSIAQSWAVISGAGNPQRAVQAMNSLEDYLILREDGIIKLLSPPFDEGDMEPGYIKGYIPGVRENGGQYTHAAAWVIIAFAKMGDGDKAWELFELINPINHTNNFREYSRYKLEPYVMAADVYTSYPNTGRGGWSWYTGSAGWMYKAGLEYILGFQKNGDTIIMDPCIPRKWKEYTIKYKYFDTKYDIKVKNPHGVNKGIKRISNDGIISSGNNIKLVNDGETHEIEVFMG